MKNSRLYKYLFGQLGDVLISIILTYITAEIGKLILNYILKGISGIAYEAIFNIRYLSFGGYTNILVVLFLFCTFYLLVTFKKSKALVSIINETETMANGNLDRTIKVKASGDIKNLAQNINNISKQLKEITVEERKAQQTKSDLITNVSHDLRTPLTSIMGYLELIDTDKYRDEVALRYYVNIAYEKSKSLNILINDLFELTKMQNNTIKLEKTPINLVELLGQVVAYFEYQFKEANMESRIRFSEDKLTVNADGEKLVRVFENLLSNAINYGKDGHYVDIETRRIDNKAIIRIINYGKAIPGVDLPFIFDRFYRVEKSRNSNIGGSGLGLAISKNIIELHEGTIYAYSDDERTIFEVRIPI